MKDKILGIAMVTTGILLDHFCHTGLFLTLSMAAGGFYWMLGGGEWL